MLIGPNAGPVFFSIAVVGLFFAFVYRRELGQWLSRFMPNVLSSYGDTTTHADRFAEDENDDEFAGDERTNELTNLGSSASESRTDERTSSFALELTNEEVRWVQAMNAYRAVVQAQGKKPTKKDTIHAATGRKGGDGPIYQRASAIYDALYAQPAAPPAQFLRSDGTKAPGTYPVTSQR